MTEEDKRQDQDHLYSSRNILDKWAVMDTIHLKEELIQRKKKEHLKNGLNLQLLGYVWCYRC